MAIEFDNPKVQRFMEENLGIPVNKAFHSVVPFQFGYENGGSADVYLFKRNDGYISYITGDLIGKKQKPSDAGNYELLIVMKDGDEWGIDLIRMLAFSTLDESLNSSETMSIGDLGKNVGFDAIIFDKYAQTVIDGSNIGIMLIMGITKKELEWKTKYGGAALLKKLKAEKVYPYSISKRESIIK